MNALDPVQIAALDFARDKPGAAFFMQQGLGKSLTALAEYSWYNALGEAEQMLIVCPNTFKQGWVDEIEKHNLPFAAHVFQSSKRDAAYRFMAIHHNAPPVLIVNYDAIRMPEVLNAVCRWTHAKHTYLAIDESIQIKGHKSRQTKALHRLSMMCTWVRLLSGKPQSQGPHDLWGQLWTIGLFQDRNFFAFRGLFCKMGGWMDKEVMEARNVELLASVMAPVCFQAKKKDWLPELPRKDATIRDYQMSDDQLYQYQQMELDFLLYLKEFVVTVDIAIAKYEKLAQIQTGFIYDAFSVAHELVDPADNPRLNLLKQILDEEVEGKCCVVYRHRPILDMLIKALALYDCAWIKGQMKPEEVEDQKRRFNTDPHCRVILLQAEASRYGHTLIGDVNNEDGKCRTMIFFENSYSSDTRDQLEDRIHRRGQTGTNVLYIDLSGSDLDRKIVKALQRKEGLYKSVFKQLKESVPA